MNNNIMAHKTCNKCGKEHSDTLNICPYCGHTESLKVTIFGYSGSYAINPEVKIYKNDEQIATVRKNERVTLDIAKPCELKFKASIRSTSCAVKPGDAVMLSFDNKSGKLCASIMKEEEAAATQEEIKQKSDSTLKVWAKALLDIFG